ncbi:MAG: lysophospholipase [Bacteroides sp.]|nr:lysophospholipase [Ruminococcus flavefaciens]MCM1555519.1 lysophospholipase [Bacteroides sp.]
MKNLIINILLFASYLCIAQRPQEPKPPFPYYSEEVVFYNKAQDVRLSGTLTLPKKGFRGTVAVLVTGSGQQDRNEEVFGHKPFLVLSDYLTRAGIGVLRYDDRGVGGSTGEFKNATSHDFSLDAEAAVDYLHGRRFKHVGMLGHSEGGSIAIMNAARRPDLAFAVLLASPGIRGDSLLLLQQEAVARNAGWPESTIRFTLEANRQVFELLDSNPDIEQLIDTLKYTVRALLGSDFPEEPFEDERMEKNVEMQIERTTNPWMLYFLGYDPVSDLRKINCPVLALNGGEDLQVPPQANIGAIESALHQGGNTRSETEIFPGLNHLFQACKTCSVSEYADLEETINAKVLERIAVWINGLY